MQDPLRVVDVELSFNLDQEKELEMIALKNKMANVTIYTTRIDNLIERKNYHHLLVWLIIIFSCSFFNGLAKALNKCEHASVVYHLIQSSMFVIMSWILLRLLHLQRFGSRFRRLQKAHMENQTEKILFNHNEALPDNYVLIRQANGEIHTDSYTLFASEKNLQIKILSFKIEYNSLWLIIAVILLYIAASCGLSIIIPRSWDWIPRQVGTVFHVLSYTYILMWVRIPFIRERRVFVSHKQRTSGILFWIAVSLESVVSDVIVDYSLTFQDNFADYMGSCIRACDEIQYHISEGYTESVACAAEYKYSFETRRSAMSKTTLFRARYLISISFLLAYSFILFTGTTALGDFCEIHTFTDWWH